MQSILETEWSRKSVGLIVQGSVIKDCHNPYVQWGRNKVAQTLTLAYPNFWMFDFATLVRFFCYGILV